MVNISAIEVIDFPGVPSAVVRRRGVPMADMGPFMDAAFSALGAAVGQGDLAPVGPPFARYEAPLTETADVEVGFPLSEKLAEPITVGEETIVASVLPSGLLATARYTGPYSGLAEAWSAFVQAIMDAGHRPGRVFWEGYETEPTPDTDPSTLVTSLAIQITDPSNP